jgi:hypothetical protein
MMEYLSVLVFYNNKTFLGYNLFQLANDITALMMETNVVPATSVICNQMASLVAQENIIDVRNGFSVLFYFQLLPLEHRVKLMVS